MHLMALVALAMIAFAANSVLCRLALGGELIDAASFTSIRLLAGAVCLAAIVAARAGGFRPQRPRWIPVFALYIYMACFSVAYQALSAGTGALLLFGCVQLTMIGVALYRGERLSGGSVVGLMLALGGMIYLVLPGVSAPPPGYSLLMAIAGVAWGVYSLFGLQGGDPTATTASNFLYATPLALLIGALLPGAATANLQGVLLAVASGAIASGIGYAVWYHVLRDIKATTAAIVQLSVPALATLGGVVFLAESLSVRIVLATALTLGGIALFLVRRSQA